MLMLFCVWMCDSQDKCKGQVTNNNSFCTLSTIIRKGAEASKLQRNAFLATLHIRFFLLSFPGFSWVPCFSLMHPRCKWATACSGFCHNNSVWQWERCTQVDGSQTLMPRPHRRDRVSNTLAERCQFSCCTSVHTGGDRVCARRLPNSHHWLHKWMRNIPLRGCVYAHAVWAARGSTCGLIKTGACLIICL